MKFISIAHLYYTTEGFSCQNAILLHASRRMLLIFLLSIFFFDLLPISSEPSYLRPAVRLLRLFFLIYISFFRFLFPRSSSSMHALLLLPPPPNPPVLLKLHCHPLLKSFQSFPHSSLPVTRLSLARETIRRIGYIVFFFYRNEFAINRTGWPWSQAIRHPRETLEERRLHHAPHLTWPPQKTRTYSNTETEADRQRETCRGGQRQIAGRSDRGIKREGQRDRATDRNKMHGEKGMWQWLDLTP